MSIFPQLWQRLFIYALILILLAPVISVTIINMSLEKELNLRLLSELGNNAAQALEGRDLRSAQLFLDFFSRDKHRVWLENDHQETMVGAPPPELAPERLAGLAERPVPDSRITLLEGDLPDNMRLVRIPVQLESGPAGIYIYLEKRPRPPISVMLVQSLVAVVLIGGVLSAWMAWRISRPLRRLRRQVLEIAEGNLDRSVEVGGAGEVAEVAAAVNSLARNLSRHIRGMRELLANISHEIRSPLARMSISTAIIEEALQQREPDGPGELPAKHLRNIQQEISLLEKLVGSTLLSSKLDLQQQQPVLADLDFSLLCRELASRQEPVFHNNGIRFTQRIAAGLRVEGDEALLSLILSNLMDNAGRHASPGGLARLALDGDRDEVRLSVDNTAERYSEEQLARFREPFYRGDIATGNGVGLGLALVDKIVACHQGRLEISAGDLGFRVTVRLPRTQKPSGDFLEWFYSRHLGH